MQESKHRFRRANVEDLDEVIESLISLDAKVAASYGIVADGQSLIKTALHVIKRGICLVGRGAVAGGIVTKFQNNLNVPVGSVLFWNFTKPSGAAIFQALVDEFERHGAKYVSATSHFPENRIGDFYCKRGLKRVEVNWLAEISTMRSKSKRKPNLWAAS